MYLLLLPEHIDRMLASLAANKAAVSIMSGENIAQLKSWRDRCAADPGYMVAYLFDT
jgi:hypothetical protein